MRTHQVCRHILLMTLISLCAVTAHPIAESDQPNAKDALEDGKNYQAFQAGVYGALITFRKRGVEIVGTASKSETVCFRGFVEGNVMYPKSIVVQRREPRTGNITYEPAREYHRERFTRIEFRQAKPFPNPWGLLELPPEIVERDLRELDECAKYLGGPPETPPCDDPDLHAATLDEGKLKYFHPGTVCRKRDSPNCTIDKIFEVMLATPGAVAPVKDIGKPQAVEHCGILVLQALPISSDANKIRTRINREHHMVTNYTLPGHIFYPGRVIRYLVDMGERIDINTEGLGRESAVKAMINEAAQSRVWDQANQILGSAVCNQLKVCKPKK